MNARNPTFREREMLYQFLIHGYITYIQHSECGEESPVDTLSQANSWAFNHHCPKRNEDV